ncbi:MAG: TIGR02679 family protein [Marmoricola sp.]
MSEPLNATLPAWINDADLDAVWVRVRERVESNRLEVRGRINLQIRTRSERHALGRLLGRTVTQDRLGLDLVSLDERLRERSGVGGLLAVLAAHGGPLQDLAAQRAEQVAAREEPLALALALVDRPWRETWVAGLRRTGLLTHRADASRVISDSVLVLEALLARSEAAPISRVELAAELLGDAHALDEDRLVHRVVLRGLAAASDVELPVTGQERRALWEFHGVLPDLLSATCLSWGLRVGGNAPVARRLDAAAQAADPVHLTAWDLRRLPTWGDQGGLTLLVCENPRVLEAVAQHATSPWPVVCTSGEPNTVVTGVLSGLVRAGATLRYHGDFDWPGLAIASRVVERFGAVPWLMGAADYESAVRAESPELTGRPVEAGWDPELAPAMQAHGRCVHEESVLGDLLAALGAG